MIDHGKHELTELVAEAGKVAVRGTFSGELKDRRTRHEALTEETYEMPEPAWEIMRALARLSPMQRASVVLHHYAGYPTKDIAVILGSTAAAVRVHLSAGRRRLREMLEGGLFETGRKLIGVGQKAGVKRPLDLFDPAVVEVVKNPRFNTGPVVNGHGDLLLAKRFVVSAELYPWCARDAPLAGLAGLAAEPHPAATPAHPPTHSAE